MENPDNKNSSSPYIYEKPSRFEALSRPVKIASAVAVTAGALVVATQIMIPALANALSSKTSVNFNNLDGGTSLITEVPVVLETPSDVVAPVTKPIKSHEDKSVVPVDDRSKIRPVPISSRPNFSKQNKPAIDENSDIQWPETEIDDEYGNDDSRPYRYDDKPFEPDDDKPFEPDDDKHRGKEHHRQ